MCVITGERYSRQCIFSWHGSQNERDERLMIIVGRVKLTDFFNLLFVCSVSSPFVAVFLKKPLLQLVLFWISLNMSRAAALCDSVSE